MNPKNRKFVAGLGLFWLMASALMMTTGFWPSLREFGVSERFFLALAWFGAVAGALAFLAGMFSGRRKS